MGQTVEHLPEEGPPSSVHTPETSTHTLEGTGPSHALTVTTRSHTERLLGKEDSETDFPPEYRANADRVVSEFLELQQGESVLFITDDDPHHSDPRLITLLQEAVKKKKGTATIFRIKGPKERHAQTPELQQLIATHDVLWIASDIADETLPVDFDTIVSTLEQTGKRMAHCTGVQAESLGKNGALAEPRSQLEERLNRMEQRLRPVAGFHIESSIGTDLWVPMKPQERRWFPDTGVIRRGKWDNLPGGEIFTTPDEEHVDGTLVLTTLHHDVTPDRGVDQPVKLTIRNGKIVTIEGGKSAEKLRNYLHANSMLAENPWSVYSCAEIAFGANTRAAEIAPCIGKDDWQKPGPSSVETEKRLGTMHIAFGCSKHGEEGTEGRNTAPTHLDFVLPQAGLTVRAFSAFDAYERARSFRQNEGGECLIDQGNWRFFS